MRGWSSTMQWPLRLSTTSSARYTTVRLLLCSIDIVQRARMSNQFPFAPPAPPECPKQVHCRTRLVCMLSRHRQPQLVERRPRNRIGQSVAPAHSLWPQMTVRLSRWWLEGRTETTMEKQSEVIDIKSEQRTRRTSSSATRTCDRERDQQA